MSLKYEPSSEPQGDIAQTITDLEDKLEQLATGNSTKMLFESYQKIARRDAGSLNPEPWTLDPEPCTLNPAPCTLNPAPSPGATRAARSANAGSQPSSRARTSRSWSATLSPRWLRLVPCLFFFCSRKRILTAEGTLNEYCISRTEHRSKHRISRTEHRPEHRISRKRTRTW